MAPVGAVRANTRVEMSSVAAVTAAAGSPREADAPGVRFAFVDVCRTLVDFYTLSAFIEFALYRHGPATVPIRYGLYRLLNWALPRLRLPFTNRRRVQFLLGLRRQWLEQTGRDFVQTCMLARQNAAVVERVKGLQADGYRVVLLSAGLGTYLRQTQPLMQTDSVICSEVAFDSQGRCTGQFAGPEVYGAEKLRRALELTDGTVVERSYAFSDHISDLPLLQFVDIPICVNPDEALRALAAGLGWDILYDHSR